MLQKPNNPEEKPLRTRTTAKQSKRTINSTVDKEHERDH